MRTAYGFLPYHGPNFRVVTLRIKGWVVSGQLGRRRDPRVPLEQPPFVRGITSTVEKRGEKCVRRRQRIHVCVCVYIYFYVGSPT